MKVTIDAISNILKKQEENQPLVHCISNFVSLNDLAQTILCYNGKPIMAHGVEEIGEITPMSKALLINLGTLDSLRLRAMEQAIKVAHRKNIPIILDPVGIHASFFRKEAAMRLISRYNVDVIKGNLSEIKCLIDSEADSKFIGIDSLDAGIKENCELRESIRIYAKRNKTIIVTTGKIDYVTDGFSEFFIENGDSKFTKITGTGCILGGMIAVGLGVASSKEEQVQAIITAVEAMGVCQELAIKRLERNQGIMSLKHYLLDEISLITDKKIDEMGNVSYEFTR